MDVKWGEDLTLLVQGDMVPEGMVALPFVVEIPDSEGREVTAAVAMSTRLARAVRNTLAASDLGE